MTFLNQFHKEAMERTMRKIEESKKSLMNSKDFADYMRHNLEQAKKIETASASSLATNTSPSPTPIRMTSSNTSTNIRWYKKYGRKIKFYVKMIAE